MPWMSRGVVTGTSGVEYPWLASACKASVRLFRPVACGNVV